MPGCGGLDVLAPFIPEVLYCIEDWTHHSLDVLQPLDNGVLYDIPDRDDDGFDRIPHALEFVLDVIPVFFEEIRDRLPDTLRGRLDIFPRRFQEILDLPERCFDGFPDLLDLGTNLFRIDSVRTQKISEDGFLALHEGNEILHDKSEQDNSCNNGKGFQIDLCEQRNDVTKSFFDLIELEDCNDRCDSHSEEFQKSLCSAYPICEVLEFRNGFAELDNPPRADIKDLLGNRHEELANQFLELLEFRIETTHGGLIRTHAALAVADGIRGLLQDGLVVDLHLCQLVKGVVLTF